MLIKWHRRKWMNGEWDESDITDKDNPFLITAIEASHITAAPDMKYYPGGYWKVIITQEHYGSRIPNTIFLLPISFANNDNIIDRVYKFADGYNKTRKETQFGYKPIRLDARGNTLKDLLGEWRKKKSAKPKSKRKIIKKCKCKK